MPRQITPLEGHKYEGGAQGGAVRNHEPHIWAYRVGKDRELADLSLAQVALNLDDVATPELPVTPTSRDVHLAYHQDQKHPSAFHTRERYAQRMSHGARGVVYGRTMRGMV